MEILSQLILNGVMAGALYALMALGFNLIYGVTRFFNLAHGVLAAIGGYAFFTLSKMLGLNIYLSVATGVAIAGLAGYGFDRLVYSKLRKRKASNLVLLVASLGVFTTAQAALSIIFPSQFQTLSETAGQEALSVLGGVVTRTQVIIIFSSLASMLGLAALLNGTSFGKAVRAISDDEEVARMVGINTGRVTGYVFFIGSALAGLAGILVGFDTGIQPTMGMGLLLKGVIASIIGGVGNIYGGVLGAFLLGLVENLGIWMIPGEWKDAVSFLLLIVFLVFRPQGIIKR